MYAIVVVKIRIFESDASEICFGPELLRSFRANIEDVSPFGISSVFLDQTIFVMNFISSII